MVIRIYNEILKQVNQRYLATSRIRFYSTRSNIYVSPKECKERTQLPATLKNDANKRCMWKVCARNVSLSCCMFLGKRTSFYLSYLFLIFSSKLAWTHAKIFILPKQSFHSKVDRFRKHLQPNTHPPMRNLLLIFRRLSSWNLNLTWQKSRRMSL